MGTAPISVFRNPEISGIDGLETAKGNVTIVGRFFGEKAPRIFIEYQTAAGEWKYKACKVLKPQTYVFRNAKGKPGKSCTKVLESDPAPGSVGGSVLLFEYPVLPSGAQPSHYVILDNGSGLNCISF